jgi:hypothetical protein
MRCCEIATMNMIFNILECYFLNLCMFMITRKFYVALNEFSFLDILSMYCSISQHLVAIFL